MTEYCQKQHLRTAKLGDEWVIIDIDHHTVTTLNDMGGYCWNVLSNTQSLNSLVHTINQEFSVDMPVEHVERDVVCFLSDLIEYGLIEVK